MKSQTDPWFLISMTLLKGQEDRESRVIEDIYSDIKWKSHKVQRENKKQELVDLEFTPQQELPNVLIHVLGICFGLIAVPFLIALTLTNHNTGTIASTIIYGLCFLMLFICSTTYHALKNKYWRRFFKKLDRICIYFLIAGTYTPIIQVYLLNLTGIVLLTVLWICVLIGIFFEIFLPDKFNVLSIIFYVLMGLTFLFVPNHFFAYMPGKIISLFLFCAALYSIGIIFYLWQRWTYHHAVWHTFVLMGAFSHYIAILGIVSASSRIHL